MMENCPPEMEGHSQGHVCSGAGCADATLVYRSFVADLETPIGVFLKLKTHVRFPFLFESVEGGAVRGRYSFITVNPDIVWTIRDGIPYRSESRNHRETDFIRQETGPIESLRALQKETELVVPPDLPPMASGLFGYLGFDIVRVLEVLPPSPPDMLGHPDALLVRPRVVLIFDSVKDTIHIAAPARIDDGAEDQHAAEARAYSEIDQIAALLNESLPRQELAETPTPGQSTPTSSNFTPGEFENMISRAIEYIYAGDVFQVVLSQRFSFDFPLPPISLYRALRRVNPSPYMYFLDMEKFQIVGASPEILVSVKSDDVVMRPLAGSRPRGNTRTQDRLLADELLADPKELAEHLMLLDLARNDVGRVAKWGSVNVTESFFVEYFSHMMHMSSNVAGTLREGKDALDALIASFPAGTLSGAPKIRAMEIINELETVKRGVYGGSIGYLAANGDIDMCIALRTALVMDGKAVVQAGVGVVADSDPGTERIESENKANALFEAARWAVQFAENSQNSVGKSSNPEANGLNR